jgi:hypothetical protein
VTKCQGRQNEQSDFVQSSNYSKYKWIKVLDQKTEWLSEFKIKKIEQNTSYRRSF